jgi:hypothetical protein
MDGGALEPLFHCRLHWYRTLRNSVSPAKPGEKSFDELVETLSKHYNPDPSEIVEHFKLHSRFRKPCIRTTQFGRDLQLWSSPEPMLRDRLVCFIREDTNQTHESCWAHTMKELKIQSPRAGASGGGSSDTPTETVPVHDLWGEKETCYCCGKPGHTTTEMQLSQKCFMSKVWEGWSFESCVQS